MACTGRAGRRNGRRNGCDDKDSGLEVGVRPA